jgi:hypothetical protein
VLGAQKAGTTALFDYLRAHPRVVGSSTKEIGFFAPEAFAGWAAHPSHAILHDAHPDDPFSSRAKLAWYHGHFPLPHRLRGRLPFEATPEYLYVPAAAARIHAYDPTIKLVALLREPAERAYAAWTMYSNLGSYRPRVYASRRELRPFDLAVADELDELHRGERSLEPGYVKRGLYAEQLERYLELFPREQLLVVDSGRLARDTGAVVNEVLAFVGLDPLPDREWPRVHVGRYGDRGPAVDETLAVLRSFYAPHDRRLAELLGQPPAWARDPAGARVR